MGALLKHLLTISNIVSLLVGAIVAWLTLEATREAPEKSAMKAAQVIHAETCQKLDLALAAAYERGDTIYGADGLNNRLTREGCNLRDELGAPLEKGGSEKQK